MRGIAVLCSILEDKRSGCGEPRSVGIAAGAEESKFGSGTIGLTGASPCYPSGILAAVFIARIMALRIIAQAADKLLTAQSQFIGRDCVRSLIQVNATYLPS